MSDGVKFFDNSARVMGDLGKRAERGLKRVAMVVEAQAKANARDKLNTTGVATGDLMNSITHEMLGSGMDSVARVGNKIVYGAIHEFGGTIRPKTAEYLVFEIDGQLIFASEVTIPSRPYLRPAVMSGREAAAKVFAEEMGR